MNKQLTGLHRLTGIESFRTALNPVTYLDDIVFSFLQNRVSQTVVTGKFKGMYLEYSRGGSEYKPKLIGTYETELDEILLRSVLLNKGGTFIDLGSDDGYYSIGLARLNPKVKAIAIECEESRCNLIQRNVDKNNLSDRVRIVHQKIESSKALQELIRSVDRLFLLKCDIEGGEYQIFDQEVLSLLASYQAYIIVETHLSKEQESEVVAEMQKVGYSVRIIDRKFSKNPLWDVKDKLFLWLYRIFEHRWTNEHRPSFNRWITGSIKQDL